MEKGSVVLENFFSQVGGMYGRNMPTVFVITCVLTFGFCTYKIRLPNIEDVFKIGLMTLGYPVVIPAVLYIAGRTALTGERFSASVKWSVTNKLD